MRRGRGARACLLRCVARGKHRSSLCDDGGRVISERLRVAEGPRRHPTQSLRGNEGDALVSDAHGLGGHVFVDGGLIRPLGFVISQNFCQSMYCS